MKEESGLVVKADTIRKFGYVCRIEKGRFEDIFVQDNYYYLCDVEAVCGEQCLDDYEEEEQFALEYVSIDHAIEVNQTANHGGKESISTFIGMLYRENRVLELIREEMKQCTNGAMKE